MIHGRIVLYLSGIFRTPPGRKRYRAVLLTLLGCSLGTPVPACSQAAPSLERGTTSSGLPFSLVNMPNKDKIEISLTWKLPENTPQELLTSQRLSPELIGSCVNSLKAPDRPLRLDTNPLTDNNSKFSFRFIHNLSDETKSFYIDAPRRINIKIRSDPDELTSTLTEARKFLKDRCFDESEIDAYWKRVHSRKGHSTRGLRRNEIFRVAWLLNADPPVALSKDEIDQIELNAPPSRDAFDAWHRSIVGRDEASVMIVGPVSIAGARQIVDTLLADLPNRAEVPTKVTARWKGVSRRVVLSDTEPFFAGYRRWSKIATPQTPKDCAKLDVAMLALLNPRSGLIKSNDSEPPSALSTSLFGGVTSDAPTILQIGASVAEAGAIKTVDQIHQALEQATREGLSDSQIEYALHSIRALLALRPADRFRAIRDAFSGPTSQARSDEADYKEAVMRLSLSEVREYVREILQQPATEIILSNLSKTAWSADCAIGDWTQWESCPR